MGLMSCSAILDVPHKYSGTRSQHPQYPLLDSLLLRVFEFVGCRKGYLSPDIKQYTAVAASSLFPACHSDISSSVTAPAAAPIGKNTGFALPHSDNELVSTDTWPWLHAIILAKAVGGGVLVALA